MCGRFTLVVDLETLKQTFPWLRVPEGARLRPRYNIAPSQPVPVVANTGERELDFFRWGLVPSWAKDPSIGSRMINARAETLAEKPSFRAAYRRRRCLILADGFYEWQKRASASGAARKVPYYVRLKSGQPFAFAGLWERWESPEGDEWLTCTIITTRSNELIAPIHDRMPVILPPEGYDRWLAVEELSPEELGGLLRPYPAQAMEAYPISTFVNDPTHDSPECIQPVEV